MWFEIIVSKDGTHFFATAKRSITTVEQAKEVYRVFKRKFSPYDGYKITVSRWQETGRDVTESCEPETRR